jgi:hypothetical protein
MSGSTLFTDLGLPSSAYNTANGYFTLSGAGGTGTSYERAVIFSVSGTGSLPVTGIDFAVSNVSGPETFFASIWTVGTVGYPGVPVANAYWSLSTSTAFGDCCGLVSVTGITNATLNGGQAYWMILGPLGLSDSSDNVWNANNQNVPSQELYSIDGGSTWLGGGVGLVSAFDITSTPEPATGPILLGLAGLGLWRGFRKRSAG